MNIIAPVMVRQYLLNLQTDLCQQLAAEDGSAQFGVDHWQRAESGEGFTRVLENGAVIERGCVNFSDVQGSTLPPAATVQHPELVGCHFRAMGVSSVIHPRNPYVPTAHLNVRFFIAEKPDHAPIWWFGGGFDLTPYYPFIEDCVHWHQIAERACRPFGEEVYPRFKEQADTYFFLKHRQETRGIGGLFFDDLNEWSFETCFDFIRSVGDHFVKAYRPVIAKRKTTPYGEVERAFQLYRRGRYVEFNLIFDRGTLFGLQFGGRTESILMSLPPVVQWRYDWRSELHSPEAKLAEFLHPRDWLKVSNTI